MFVRRLLVSAVLASLAACAAPTSTFVVDKNPNLKQRTTIGSVDALDYQLMPKRESAAFSATVFHPKCQQHRLVLATTPEQRIQIAT